MNGRAKGSIEVKRRARNGRKTQSETGRETRSVKRERERKKNMRKERQKGAQREEASKQDHKSRGEPESGSAWRRNQRGSAPSRSWLGAGAGAGRSEGRAPEAASGGWRWSGWAKVGAEAVPKPSSHGTGIPRQQKNNVYQSWQSLNSLSPGETEMDLLVTWE